MRRRIKSACLLLPAGIVTMADTLQAEAEDYNGTVSSRYVKKCLQYRALWSGASLGIGWMLP